MTICRQMVRNLLFRNVLSFLVSKIYQWFAGNIVCHRRYIYLDIYEDDAQLRSVLISTVL